MTIENWYALLEVAPSATSTDIKRAYRRLVMRYHPDRNQAEDAAETFQRIVLAYQTLSDPKKRQHFDWLLEQRRSVRSETSSQKPSTEDIGDDQTSRVRVTERRRAYAQEIARQAHLQAQHASQQHEALLRKIEAQVDEEVLEYEARQARARSGKILIAVIGVAIMLAYITMHWL